MHFLIFIGCLGIRFFSEILMRHMSIERGQQKRAEELVGCSQDLGPVRLNGCANCLKWSTCMVKYVLHEKSKHTLVIICLF